MREQREKMINKFWSLVCVLAVLLTVILPPNYVRAASVPRINTTSVTLYGLESGYENVLQIPSNVPQQYQLTVQNATSVNYSVLSGSSAKVSQNGLVEINYTTMYWYGIVGYSKPKENQTPTSIEKNFKKEKTVIRVVADGVTFDVDVEVKSYSDKYVEDEMQAYIDQNIKPQMNAGTMTDLELMNAIAAYPASFDYNAAYYSYKSMVIYKGGDCWASTSTIIKMCNMLGIDAWNRNGNKDPGSGSGHRNAIVSYNGKYYELEAGYTGTAPRHYRVKERQTLFSYSVDIDQMSGTIGATIYQYDGKEAKGVLEIPAYINQFPVLRVKDTTFEYDQYTEIKLPETLLYIEDFAFHGCRKLEKINIPGSVNFIGKGAFSGCDSLNDITISAENENYCTADGGIYTKDMKKLVCCPKAEDLIIPNTVEELCDYAVYDSLNLASVVLPASIKKLGEMAIADNVYLRWIDMSALLNVEIRDSALSENSSLKSIKFPQSVSSWGQSVFADDRCLQNLLFYGDMPEKTVCNDMFEALYLNATVQYPENNNTWIAEKMNDYGGKVTYKAWKPCVYVDLSQENTNYSHAYQTEYVWDDDLKNCEIRLTCPCGFWQYQNVSTVVDSQIPAKCGEDGSIRYKATVSIDGKSYTDYKTEAIPMLHHEYTDVIVWSEDYATCDLVFTCKYDKSHQFKVPMKVEETRRELPTCHKAGYINSKSSVDYEGQTYVDVKDQVLEQLVHDFSIKKISNETRKQVATSESPAVYYYTCSLCGEINKAKDALTFTDGSALVYPVSVYYTTHVQSYGWQGNLSNYKTWKKDGAMAGTSGEAKRLEAIEIKLETKADLHVNYRTHVQSYGWESSYRKDGAMSGTSGQGKRLEAISIYLTGKDAAKYDIFYRVHAQSYGWLGWAKNGENAGTAAQAKRLEGIEIVVFPKNQTPSTGTLGYSYIELGKKATNSSSAGMVNYMTHVQSYGDQNYVYDGSVSGTFGEAKRLEGIRIKLNNQKTGYSGSIQYRTQVQTYGWLPWSENGDFNGTHGEAKRLEAIEIKLEGEVAKYYDVYYRVHSQTYGWLGWAKNGEVAGTVGLAKRLEGIQVVLVPKGQGAPNYLPGKYGMPASIAR